MSAVWSMKDFHEGRCAFVDVDKARPEAFNGPEETPEQLVEALPLATMAELKQAALRVARETGSYEDFLRRHPHFHEKFLLSMAKDATPPNRDNTIRDIPWLNRERLQYKRDRQDHVEDAKMIEG